MRIESNNNISLPETQIVKYYNAFKGINIHILDGGFHGENMKHFANAIMKNSNVDLDILMHRTIINNLGLNQLNSLMIQLKSLNTSNKIKNGDYLAIPSVVPISLKNLEAGINKVFSSKINLTPQNIKTNKNTIMAFLKKVQDSRFYYPEQLNALDKYSQGLGFAYSVIEEIAKLVQKGIKVYVPASNPNEKNIKTLAEQNNKSEELYRAISHPENTDYRKGIIPLVNEIKEKGDYEFNLTSLSDAHVVNLKGEDNQDYIFSAYDSCINDGARGVYNFCPVRNAYGELKGYSYQDETTVEYSVEDFPKNLELTTLCKYVGQSLRDMVASNREHQRFKDYIENNKRTESLPAKLYRINEIFSEREIDEKNLNYLGKLIDNQKKYIFDISKDGKILFQKYNCEGTERPSVYAMQSSGFSTLSAIKRDILALIANDNISSENISYYITKADNDNTRGYIAGAEHYYNKVIDFLHPDKTSLNCDPRVIDVYEKLYKILKKSNNTSSAKEVANTIIDLKSYLIKDLKPSEQNYYTTRMSLSKYYSDLAIYCYSEKDIHSYNLCRWASGELYSGTYLSAEIIKRRSSQNRFLDDLYNKYH